MMRTSGAFLLVTFLGGCSAFYQDPDPVRTTNAGRPGPMPAPSVPTWNTQGQNAPYQLVDQGAKDRMNATANLANNLPRTNPISPYGVMQTGASAQETASTPPLPSSPYPSAYVSGPTRNDLPPPKVVIGKETPKSNAMN